MIKRDVFGKLYLYKKNKKGIIYKISKISNNNFKILKIVPLITTDACLKDETFIWQDIPSFKNKVQAYLFLKKNIENMM